MTLYACKTIGGDSKTTLWAFNNSTIGHFKKTIFKIIYQYDYNNNNDDYYYFDEYYS